MRTPRGRIATPSAWDHLDLEPPVNNTAEKQAPNLLNELDK